MFHPQSPWLFERPEQLAEALREQGAAPEEIADLLPALRRLSEWQAPQPSPTDTRRLLARLATALGYGVGLGLALSLALWVGGTGQVLALTLSWLMPLLLVAGLALMLSLRLSVQAAASLAYGVWLAVLAISTTSPLQALILAPQLSVLLGCIGLAGLSIAL